MSSVATPYVCSDNSLVGEMMMTPVPVCVCVRERGGRIYKLRTEYGDITFIERLNLEDSNILI